MKTAFLSHLFGARRRAEIPRQVDAQLDQLVRDSGSSDPSWPSVGLIAGNGPFPLHFAFEARKNHRRVIAVCHVGETDPRLEKLVDEVIWVRVGELGKIIDTFCERQVPEVAFAGGIRRVKLFGGVKLDKRGAALLLRLKSAKDDVIMRGIAEELESEGVQVISCATFLQHCIAREGVLTRSQPTTDELNDIDVGATALAAMGAQHIGQLLVVREGVIVAVEAVEGSDEAIRRGGKLGGKGAVVVKLSKPSQDMRFDVPTVGVRTLQTMHEVGARVLALEADSCLIMNAAETVAFADACGICIVVVKKS